MPGARKPPRTGSDPTDELRQARPALRRFFTVAGVLLLLCAVPYLHDSMEDYRYLDRIDASPLWRAITLSSIKESQAAAILPGGMPSGGGQDDDIEANLWHDPALQMKQARTPDDPAPGHAAPKGEDRSAKPSSKGHAAAAPPPESPSEGLPAALVVTAASIGKHKVFFEDPGHELDPFYAALVDLVRGRRDKVRVRHYGDSHIANDGTTHALRVMLQRRFGDGGHGFVLVKSRTRWYKHKGIKTVASDGFKVRNFLGGGLPDGAFGYGGVAASGGPGQSFRVETAPKGLGDRASRFELFMRALGPARLQVTVGGKRRPDIKLGPNKGDVFKLLTFPDGPQRVRVKVQQGMVRFFGAVLERDRGVVYDCLGVVGARASRWGNVKAPHIAAQIKHRDTDLLVLNYGGNSLHDKVSKKRYVERFIRTLKRLRPDPAEPCLILGPSDHGKRGKGTVISDPAGLRVAGWQREIARSQGCAFFDSIAAMGGKGSMGRWVKRGLGWKDFAHFTPKGMRAMGRALYAAHLHGLKDYLRRHPEP